MAKRLSSRGLTNRLSLTGGRWIRRTPGWRSRRVARAGPKDVPNPGVLGPDAVHQKTISVPQRIISDPSGT
jgi:hypothetical protein